MCGGGQIASGNERVRAAVDELVELATKSIRITITLELVTGRQWPVTGTNE